MTCIMTRSLDFIQLKAKHLASHGSKNKILGVFGDFSFLRSRKTVRHIRSSKVFFIMRGLPGSGKSTLVRAIKSRFKKALVCSADSFFVQKDGSYAFDSEKLPEAHEECASLARQAAEMGVRHIVVDNTNILRWEMGKYFKLANEYGYAVIVVEPKTPWRLEPVELAAKNIHGCTADVVEQKMKKFKAILPVFWGWFFDETVASELLTLGEKYFDLCMRTVPEFASYMNELGVSKGLTLPLSFKEFYNRPKYLLHCTSFFSGSKTRSYGTGEYADCPEVQRSMGKAFDMKLVGIMFSQKTVGIRVILNKLQLSLWGAEDVWSPQPPPKPKTNEATQSTDSSKVLMQDTPKMQKQRNGKRRRGDTSKVRKRDENDTKSASEVCFNVDALDTSLNDMSLDFLMDMAPPQSGTELAEDPTGIKTAPAQSGYNLSPYLDVIESASFQNGIEIEPDKSVTSLVSDLCGSEDANVQNCSKMALGENGAKTALCENVTTLTLPEKSVSTMLETCCVAVGDDRTEDSVEEIHDLQVGENISYYSCLESGSSLINCQKHQTDIPSDGYCHMPQTLNVEDVATCVGELSQILSAHQEESSAISAENICQIPPIHEENKQSLPVDKFSRLPSDSSNLQDHQELTSTKINDVNLSDFLLKDVESEDICKLSQSNISSHEVLEDNASNLLENSANLSVSDICPEPTQGEDSIPVEGSSDEVPRIQLKQGSRAHITLGCAAGYSAVQTGFDQMELLLCEENGEMIGESVVTDDVEIAYYGEGRCTVYFDWPLYKSALFTGVY